MNKKYISRIILALIATLLLAACGNSADVTPTVDPLLIMTDVAGTIQADFTQTALSAPTVTIPPPPTTTALPLPSLPAPSAPSSPAMPTPPPGELPDNATWIADVESPDGTIFESGQRFTRVTQIENTGTTIWNTGYRLIYYGGEPIMCDEADMDIYLQQSVDPGNQILLSVRFTAPDQHGTYVNHFRMINDKGEVFGDNLFVEIVVGTWEAKQTQLAE